MRTLTAVFAGMVAVLAFSSSALTDIENSKHDLTIDSPAPSNPSLLGGVDACAYCHAPHDVIDPERTPLWNRSDPVTVSFAMYGTTMSGNSPDSTPNTASLRCLSCHDGATAVDAFDGNIGTPAKTLGPPYNVGAGGILGDDHPVSISASGMAVPVATAETAGLIFYGDGASPKLECPTCHDPHDTDHGKFLRVDFRGSTLCQVCHAK